MPKHRQPPTPPSSPRGPDRPRSMWFASVLIVLALGLVACGTSNPAASDADVTSDVVLVVGDAGAVAPGEARLHDHLSSSLPLPVRLVGSAEVVVPLDAALVVLAPSADGARLGTMLRNAAVPVVALGRGWFEPLGFEAGPGASAAPASRVVANAGGVRGEAAGGPVVVAYESGEPLAGGAAPGRRVGIGAGAHGRLSFGHEDIDLIDAAIGWVTAGRDDAPVSPVDDAATSPVQERRAMLLIGAEPGVLSPAEESARARLQGLDFVVTVVEDASLRPGAADAFDLVVMSKSVRSTVVGAGLKATPTPVLFWEDNQQRSSMLATIGDDGADGTAWHAPGLTVHVDDEVPADLRAGLAGPVDLYLASGEITYAPSGTLGADAIPVASFGSSGEDGRQVIYVYDQGATLADGSLAQGRRGYFGLYDPTFPLLSGDGLALFDALVAWLTRP